ncbi:ADP-ribose pyrophosphatase YjhB (NUDIX family) [Thiogranum longum]|uniref:Phosphatase NudJ n=1 Tax=Thiogranum longum TaxID=1537524 RepID=A0A4R1HCK4_9GAMM|nr:NUDIX hydrolase [Thiogranum longum]TCK18283.1 ADP-ribose pyrophosphatase YjhB (NUDIX family) [Thiogranum longum]
MTWKPRATVAVICEKNRHFLMVEENVYGKTRFNQPAGHLEDRESLVEAARRECLEETACRFKPQALVGLYRWRNNESGDTFLRATFCGECAGPEAGRALDNDIIAAHWMTLDEIRAHQPELRSPLVLRSLEDYIAGKRYPLELLVDV